MVAAVQLVVMAAVTLDTSWDLFIGCLSCGGGYTWDGGGFGQACGAEARIGTHTRSRSMPEAVVPCGALALAGIQQPTQNRCGPRGMTNNVWELTQESHKKLWYESPMGGQGPSKHREGKVDRDKLGGGWARECVSKSMYTISGGDRRAT
jgi:hypothetical protein